MDDYGICQDILKEQRSRGLLAKNEHFSELFCKLCLRY